MPPLKAYHRPDTIEATLALLARSGIKTSLLAGGTYLNSHLEENIEEVVDLQDVGLDHIRTESGRLVIQSMVNLQAITDYPDTPDLLWQVIKQEFPNTFRHAATPGGVIAGADWESETLAALLALEAQITIQTPKGTKQLDLSDFLADAPASLEGGLITEIDIAIEGKTDHARVARTPKDKAIVGAAARQTEDGSLHLALCGVAATPIKVNPDDLARLNPPGDFRGSSSYRAQMAAVLSRRVIETLEK